MSSSSSAPPIHRGHPIQIVARRTGLSADVIRAWEKRYAVVRPVRSDAGRRLYSDDDIDRLRLIARATRAGRTVGQVAALPPEELRALASNESAVASRGEDAVAPTRGARDLVHTCLDAVGRFDPGALDAALRRATIALSAEVFLDAVVLELWRRVTDAVRRDALRPSQQHFTHAALRRVLDRMAEASTLPGAGPDLVVATAPGETQELGTLLAAAAAAAEGWRVVYLGPGLPADDIAEAVARVRARAVTVSLGGTPNDHVIPRELRRLRTLLPSDVVIIVEGTATDVDRAVVREIGASVVRDVPALFRQLRALRAA